MTMTPVEAPPHLASAQAWKIDRATDEYTITISGPWDEEPDKIQWVDETTDLDCLMVRNRFGNWCGYVGVPNGHKAFLADYDDVPVSVHGGLTFAGMCQNEGDGPSPGICHVPLPGRPHQVYWLGFDCGHGFDFAPGLHSMELRLMPDLLDKFRKAHYDHAAAMASTEFAERRYRTMGYVAAEVTDLARQLASL